MNWYEEDIRRLEEETAGKGHLARTVFYGSSSIRLWQTLEEDFKEYTPVNLGFGGSTLAACIWFFHRIVAPYRPSLFVLYAGENDIGDGRHPEEVFIFYQHMVHLIRKHYGDIPLAYISIKPSIARLGLLGGIKKANRLIAREIRHSKSQDYYINVYDSMVDTHGHPLRELYDDDGLHLNANGYALWRKVVGSSIRENIVFEA
jgi:lysophospholipase L1-like esterase